MLCTLGRRVGTLLWHFSGIPGIFPKLLVPEGKRPALAWLKEVYEAWLVVKGKKTKTWVAIQARSPFKLVYVQKVCIATLTLAW